jgi:hypothetical protein
MKNFTAIVAERAITASHDNDVQIWAARAFSVLATIGNHPDITDEIGELFADLLSLAPDTVLQDGTIMVLGAYAKQKFGDPE